MAYREEWRKRKATLEKSGIKMAEVADKANFGPALDKWEAAFDAFQAHQGDDQKKEEKLKAALKDAGSDVVKKGREYLKGLDSFDKDLKKSKSPQAKAQVQTLGGVIIWLGQTLLNIEKDSK